MLSSIFHHVMLKVVRKEGLMEKHKVTFLPDEKVIEAVDGALLIEAAEEAGVYLNSLCGGEGVCGKCRVQIVKGKAKVNGDLVAFFTKDEIEKGYVLACQTPVKEDLEVLIPPESRLEEEQILGESRENKQKTWRESPPIHYSEPDWVSLHKRPSDPASLFEPLTN